jgi:iron(II)-dependent oxidoreductase
MSWIAAIGHCQDGRPWEQRGTKTGDEIIGPDGGKMVWVPAGEFDMGSTDANVTYVVERLSADEAWMANEKPAHRVRITKGFWLGQCLVTNAQYRRFCQESGAEFPTDSDQGDNHPVVCMTWGDAKAYCKHYGLALPTEAQWEYAARGPEDRTYPWGNDWDPKNCCSADNLGPEGRTFPVGSFPQAASWCGALDMAGNAWQWCADWYHKGYYRHSPTDDPKGPPVGDLRVLKGGSWLTYAVFCRSADRIGDYPACRKDHGFRCMVSPR